MVPLPLMIAGEAVPLALKAVLLLKTKDGIAEMSNVAPAPIKTYGLLLMEPVLPSARTPAFIAVGPVYVLAPFNVNVPAPILVKLSAPPVFSIRPLNALVWLLLPTVNVAAPTPELLTTPSPPSPLIVWLNPARSRMPDQSP